MLLDPPSLCLEAVPFDPALYEELRLQALHASKLLTEPAGADYKEAVQLAAALCNVPMAFISVVDRDRQHFKVQTGLPFDSSPRQHSFCNYVLGREHPLLIPDTHLDSRFCDNPFVTEDPGFRFYAGVPINTADGFTLGTLCVADTVPHTLSALQQAALAGLGRQLSSSLHLQARVQELKEALEAKRIVEQELRRRDQFFDSFMNHGPMVAFMKDAEGRLTYYNQQFAERFEIPEKGWLGKNDFELWPEDFARKFREVDLQVLAGESAVITIEQSPGPDGSTIHWRTYKFAVEDGNGGRSLAGLSLDITQEREAALEFERGHAELQRANKLLLELSVTDPLTGLRNRRAFDHRLEQEILFATRSGSLCSVLLIDVDHFKSFNDKYGHGVGDEVLRCIARSLEKSLRYFDLVARYGGEEFAVILPETSTPEALKLAERVRRAIASLDGCAAKISVSIGVSSFLDHASSESVLASADRALYRAKACGRNRVILAERIAA